MEESTLTAKGQTTVPKEVRRALGAKPGDRLRYLVLDDGEVRILRTRPVLGMSGLLARDGQGAVSLEDMDMAIAERGAGRS